MAKTAPVLTQPSRKRTQKKRYSALSTCPADAVGWCSYPFTIAQLEKKLKRCLDKDELKLAKSFSQPTQRNR